MPATCRISARLLAARRARDAALDDAPADAARLDDDGQRRQRRQARDLGLLRARRERLRPAARQRQPQPRSGALDAPLGGRAPGRDRQRPLHLARAERERLRAGGDRRGRARGRHDRARASSCTSCRSASAGCCSTTRSRSTRTGGSTSSSSAAPASRRWRSSTGWPSATTPSCCSSSSWPPTTSTTSPGRTGRSAAARVERGGGLPDPRRVARRAAQARGRRDERARRLRPRRRLAARASST